jgi:hypothetical protein
MKNKIFNAIIRFCVRHCSSITCSTFDEVIAKDRMGVLRRRLNK